MPVIRRTNVKISGNGTQTMVLAHGFLPPWARAAYYNVLLFIGAAWALIKAQAAE